VSKKKKYAQGARAIADTGATDHLFKERMELQNATKSLKRFWDFSGTKCIEASRQGIQHIYVFNPNDIHEPGGALALPTSTMKGITDDIISLPRAVKGMGYKCKLDNADGWEGLYKVDSSGREYGHLPLVWDQESGLWYIHFSIGKTPLEAYKNRKDRLSVTRKQLEPELSAFQPSIQTTGMPRAATFQRVTNERYNKLRDKIQKHYAGTRRRPAPSDARVAAFNKFKDKYKTEADYKASKDYEGEILLEDTNVWKETAIVES
jgi:hypothetical protein